MTSAPGRFPRLSVIVPCFNNAATLGGQLEAIATQDYEGWFEVIVVDNGSTDGSALVAETFRSTLPRLRVVDASGSRGAGHARNVGARQASGDAFVFCDADDEVGPGWLGAIAAALTEHPFVASRVEVAPFTEPWVRQTRRVGRPGESLPYPPFLPHAGGSGMGVQRAVFEAVGGFDESFLRLQDTDLCVRVQLGGTPLHVADDAVVYCRYQTRWMAIFHQGRSYAFGNAKLFARHGRHAPTGRLWLKWPFRHWATIVRAAARPWSPGARARLAWSLGWQVGRVEGTIRFRVPAV